MKRKIFLLILAGVFLTGCGGMAAKRDVIFPEGQGKALITDGIPSPRAGLVPLFNESEGAWAEVFLLEDHLAQDEIVGADKYGKGIFISRPIAYCSIKPRLFEFPGKKSLILEQEMDYTLFIIFTDVLKRVVDRFYVVHFSTSSDPFRDKYDGDVLGNTIFGDPIIFLPTANRNQRTRLKFHKTLDLGYLIRAALLGM